MRGKNTRCKNPICQAVFEVQTPEPPPEAPTANDDNGSRDPAQGGQHISGVVGDLVPILPGEALRREAARPPRKKPEQPAWGGADMVDIIPVLPTEPAPVEPKRSKKTPT